MESVENITRQRSLVGVELLRFTNLTFNCGFARSTPQQISCRLRMMFVRPEANWSLHRFQQKGAHMSHSLRIALLAGLGIAAMALPATAAPSLSDGVRTTKGVSIEFAQRREDRDGNFRREDRDGNFKKGKKMKKSKVKKVM